MKMIQCQKCGQIYPANLKKCPKCFEKRKSNFAVNVFAICVLTFAIVFMSGIAISIITDDEVRQAVEEITVTKENKTSKIANRDLGNVLTGTVELTISKDMLTLFGDDFDYTLTAEQKEQGFTDIKKNEDGSVTYTIKKKDYEKYISEYRKTTQDTIDELTTGGDYPSIEKIEYTENLETITIIANKKEFEDGLDSMAILNCGLTSCFYQAFDVDAKGKCTVNVKDRSTGEIFQTTIYPDAMKED